jgi:hypothetical protein
MYVYVCKICYLYCINAATGWTTHLQFSDDNNNNNKKKKISGFHGGGSVLTIVTRRNIPEDTILQRCS